MYSHPPVIQWNTHTIRQPSSARTFSKAWESNEWSKKLKFIPVGHHSQCPECARLKEWRRVSKTDEDRAKVEDAFSVHISSVMLDRATVSRADEIAHRSMRQTYIELSADFRHGAMTIDGMDQAKFRVPRWKFAKVSKELEGLWRPQLHVHGALVHGCCEL